MRVTTKNRTSPGLPAAIVLVLISLIFPPFLYAETLVETHIVSNPVVPQPIASELSDIFTDTLVQVLFENEESDGLLESDPDTVAEAIRTGINIVIQPKGYSVTLLELDFSAAPVRAVFHVSPVGWTEEEPNAVLDVDVVLSHDGLPDFWYDRFTQRLEERRQELIDVYRRFLTGLPAGAIDREWSTSIIMPYLLDADPSVILFPDFDIELAVQTGAVAVVTLKLTPVGDVINLVRPRMYSMTLYNVILDRLRERVLAEADFIEGMPRAEVDMAAEEIAAQLEFALEQDVFMQELKAYSAIEVTTIPDEPVVRVDVMVESRLYDLDLEVFVDFGNEARDTAEVQARLGFLLARGAEVFVNLNYFTNDSTLETDLALGFRPMRGTFSAIGYDLEREAFKYFIEQELGPGLILRGEIFEEDDLNEFGMTYQFQQYLSAGMYTNGNNEYWVRAIFKL